MQESNKKQNANPVGATSSRPNFEGITLKKPNGITLIALIITIIVMLILVGVTINVALNGGLFTKASQASKQMQVEADRETLLSAVVAAIGYDGKVKLGEIQLPNGWKGTNGTYTSPKGNTYTVDENGKIEEGDSKAEEPPTLELVQIDAGTYTDHTLIGLNISFSSFEQLCTSFENMYKETGVLEENMTIEDFALNIYNEGNGTNYKTIKETGYTFEEIFEELNGEKWEDMGTRLVMDTTENIKVKQPDNTVLTVGEVNIWNNGDELEGMYHYHSLQGEKCNGYCYSATQTGTYEITIEFGDYVLTDTITIENF